MKVYNMAEVGCLKDGHFQNISCEGNMLLDGDVFHTGVSALQDARVSNILSLGPDSQTEGVFSAKIDTGLVNGPTIFTIPDPGNGSTNSAVGGTPIADGPIELTFANVELLAKGFIIGTATGESNAVTLPHRHVFRDIFGPNRKAGDSFIYRIHNKSTTDGLNLILTTATEGGTTLVGESNIMSNSSLNSTGQSVGTFMCRLVSGGVDADTVHYRLS